MSLLETSQIIFNVVASLAITIVSVFIGIIAFNIIMFMKKTKKMVSNLHEKSNELYHHIDNIFSIIIALPFISTLFKKKKSKQ
jgi:hypothetical protein